MEKGRLMKKAIIPLISAAMLPGGASAQSYFARIGLVDGQYDGSWSNQSSSPYCVGPDTMVDVTQTCTGGACDPAAMADPPNGGSAPARPRAER